MRNIILALSLLCAVPCFALPDSPIAKPVSIHPFYDRQARITLYVAAAAGGMDLAQTCHALSNGFQEFAMPTQQCYQLVLIGIGTYFAVEGIGYALHKTGHHKLERIPRYFLIGGNIAGLATSHTNGTF